MTSDNLEHCVWNDAYSAMIWSLISVEGHCWAVPLLIVPVASGMKLISCGWSGMRHCGDRVGGTMDIDWV